jgi:serine/threonine-protein kinase
LDAQRWRQVKAVFQDALERPRNDRARFLSEACGDDGDLRREVGSLLASYEEEPGFIEAPPAMEAGLALVSEATTAPATPGVRMPGQLSGRRIGPYAIGEPIGSGGMGTVYLGRRADEGFHQNVAIKVLGDGAVIDRPLDSARRDERVRRFRTERQTLANLNHPSIPKLLDTGITEDGLCYIVMEYVEGEAVDFYCDARGLSITRRLELFRQVCSAVHHAHQNLVVHRDLKPANILVTADGSPKLLDFGIAKLLETDGAPPAKAATQTGWQVMTPGYASPEQVAGGPITTASDVYSLGVVLYELLTGRRPYRLASPSRRDILQAICEQEPERPSTRVMQTEVVPGAPESSETTTLTPDTVSRTREGTPERLRRRLSGDLDTIVMMALRKEPQRRYSSAEQLSEDIRRHLAGLPVMARKDTVLYRGGKFVRRHRAGVATAALTALCLTGGTVVTARLAQVAGSQRAAAEAARQAEKTERIAAEESKKETEAALTFLVELFGVSDPFIGSTLTKKRGLSVTAGEILESGAEKVREELADSARVRARLMDAIGSVYQRLGALEPAEQLLRDALELRLKELGESNTETATTLNNLGALLLERGEHAEASSLLERAAMVRRRLLGDDDPVLATTLSNLAALAQRRSELAIAESLYREALGIYERAKGAESVHVAVTLGNLANVLYESGKRREAIEMQRRCVTVLREEHGSDHAEAAQATGNLGAMLIMDDQHEEAEPLLREAVEIGRRTLGGDHPVLAQALHNLAGVHEWHNDPDQAMFLYAEALEMRRRVLGEDHPEVARTLNNIGHLQYVRGDYAGAEETFREVLAILEVAQATEPNRDLGLAQHNLGSALMMRGRLDEAAGLFDRALSLRRQVMGARHLDVAETLANMGGVAYRRKRYDEAAAALEEALDIRRETLGADSLPVGTTLASLGAVLRDAGRLEEAEPICREAVEIHRKYPQAAMQLGAALTAHGLVLTRLGRPEEGEPLVREALEIRTAAMPTHWTTANTASALGECLTALARYGEAEPLLLEGLERLREARGPDDQSTLDALDRVVAHYEKRAMPEKAGEYRRLRSER